MSYYMLAEDGKTPIPTNDMIEWGIWMGNIDARTVKKTVLLDCKVSTVFLGIDHNWRREWPPILWETMVFGGEHNDFLERWSTYDDAAAGHEEVVRMVITTNSN